MSDSPISRNRLITILCCHIGRRNGIHMKHLVTELTRSNQEDTITERKVRSMIQELRMEGYHICAHPSDGYFVAETPEELNEACEFLYDRAMTSLTQISRMKNIALPDLRGQLHLPS